MSKTGSKILSDTVEMLSTLPGIGKKSAWRMALHVAQQENYRIKKMAEILIRLGDELKICKNCYLYSDNDLCNICANPQRDKSIVCVVESIKDVLAIEETSQFHGTYHVLGGLISPIDGIGPDRLNIDALLQRIIQDEIKELIMAIRPSIEGDTTIYYISKHIPSSDIKISQIARGVSFGSELEFTDEITLGRSILSRTPYLVHENQWS